MHADIDENKNRDESREDGGLSSGHPHGQHRAGAPGRRDRVVRAAVRSKLVSSAHLVTGFVDADGVRASVHDLHQAFGDAPVLHTFAAKAASLVPVLRLLADCGMGCEVASPGELRLALAAGFTPSTIVLDSPAKTREEIRQALALGVALNADNLDELRRIDALRPADSASVVGLRVNPQVGTGSIGAMSTATTTSKFGVALRDPGAHESVVRAFAERPWLTRLHAHVGSQGCPLDLIATGIKETYELAEEINAAVGRRQVTSLDIGGGLPVNFDDDTVRPTYADYVGALRAAVPDLFDGRYALVTEFGRSLLAKNGFIAARVEYVKDAGGRRIAITHAGAQIATRTVFMPDAWPLRVSAFDADGRPKEGPALVQDIAGPCCFAGDVVAHARELPELRPDDLVVLHDTGAYYFSTPWAYNSLPRPAVHGFTIADDDTVHFVPVRHAQSLDEVVAESGLANADALLGQPAPALPVPASH
ncbi:MULTISPECIES: diaminopimelate decarboxylase [unclassified Streptomyces]|uniref:diaminopimelate decarboxylase n=1 Tax=unclassified Streptomyces TaxID=2593676 RepID=UPI002DDAB3DB|nr:MULTISPECIES: diaminopimelate decarboxylase [unclassified Streptomyces]WSA96636.1 diaminopimelate decarboxylase [Streptomyces sp. NBC_01795]WSB81051.1 diaminopimelate decarboxylase [Streptomyces sp. NBC_01775]WSS10739.1 diaminopimelate decarboxylase [Streptomyces sp. NBC_01186]WSS39434.1 diaminopimelate decarboxylase [Streptomyces sp. NBC_01187]